MIQNKLYYNLDSEVKLSLGALNSMHNSTQFCFQGVVCLRQNPMALKLVLTLLCTREGSGTSDPPAATSQVLEVRCAPPGLSVVANILNQEINFMDSVS